MHLVQVLLEQQTCLLITAILNAIFTNVDGNQSYFIAGCITATCNCKYIEILLARAPFEPPGSEKRSDRLSSWIYRSRAGTRTEENANRIG